MLKLAKEKRRVCARYDVLCESLNKNEVPLITVTGPNSRQHPIEVNERHDFPSKSGLSHLFYSSERSSC